MANRVDVTGSQVYARPPLQLLNDGTAKNITKQVKGVFDSQRKGEDWKLELRNAAVIWGAALTLIVVGAVFHVGFAIGVGAALAAYGLLVANRVVEKYSNAKNSEKVHNDATNLRLSKVLKRIQDTEMAQGGRRQQNAAANDDIIVE